MSQNRTPKEDRQPLDDETPDADHGNTALSVDGLSKTFGNGAESVTAVDDVSFTVSSGSIVGILGPNGAGKTSLIKLILGLVRPDSGTAEIAGYDVFEESRKVHRNVDAMMEGARNDYWRLTVEENLRFFASVSGQDPDSISDRHEELLRQLDLEDKKDEEVRHLSRGMKQKVALASTLASDVPIVFLDEPTLGLDVESSLRLRREIDNIVQERGLTVVLSSHDMDTIQELCDRAIIMSDGEVIADDSIDNLLEMFRTQEFEFSVRNLEAAQQERLQSEFNTTNVTSYDDRDQFTVAVDTETFFRLSRTLEQMDVRILTIETVTPDLEEIFMNIVEG